MRMILIPTSYFIIFLCASFLFVSAEDHASEVVRCNKHYTSDFSYGQFYKISDFQLKDSNGLYFPFQVKTPSDAHIKFSERPFPSKEEPAYEVVIGAGKNSFSFIRRKEVELSKIRLDTPNILSSQESRGFWIRITERGRIIVGKEGKVDPFMIWEDDFPLDLKFFSFSSWQNFSAQWSFNCTKMKEKTEGPPTLQDLIDALMEKESFYSRIQPPFNPAVQNYTIVYAHLFCRHVNLDERRSILDVDGVFSLLWEDRRMSWSPKEYSNIQQLDWYDFEMWTPMVKLHNIADKDLSTRRDGNSKVRIFSNGSLLWTYPVYYSALCAVKDYRNWPKDKHICELQLGFKPPLRFLKFIPMRGGIEFEESRIHTVWNIENVDVKTKWLPSLKSVHLDEQKYREAKHIIFEFNLNRSNNAYYIVLKISIATIYTLTMLSFWASPLGIVKIGIQCISLVIASLSLLFCWELIPVHNSEEIPSVLSAFVMSMHLVWVSIVSSVVLSSFIFLVPVRMTSSISCFLNSKYVVMFFCLPQPSNQVAKSYNLLCGDEILNNEGSQGYSFKSMECESQWNLILISKITERILFCIYCALFLYAFTLFN